MAADSARLAQRRSLLLRIHFWAALIASPFLLAAALTGLAYVFTPQIEAALHARLDQVAPGSRARALDEIVQAAQAAAPAGHKLRSVTLARDAAASVQVVFGPAPGGASPGRSGAAGHSGHANHGPGINMPAAHPAGCHRIPRGTAVYVDPFTAQVVGSHDEMERYGVWTRRLHSTLLLGDGGRWPIELGASWMIVMLLTGAWLWWPRGGARALPTAHARGRVAWKAWHAFTGVLLAVLVLVVSSSGLECSKNAGSQLRAFRDAIGQAPTAPPRGLQSAPSGEAPLGWEALLRIARQQAPGVDLQITPPADARGTWRFNSTQQTAPEHKVTLVLDAFSGATLFRGGWEDQSVFSKATALGMMFHRGEFGWWNQALLLLVTASVLFSLVSGWVMFVLRRRHGTGLLPRLLPGAWTSLSVGGWATLAILAAAMPLFAASLALVLLLEFALSRPGARAALARG